jgi:arsenate reductase-like glutaredoxin family protein
VTLFHKPSSSASTRVHTILKQAHAQAAAHATEDQASSHKAHEKLERVEFDLDVTEAPPTSDQLKNILEYLGGSGAVSKVIRGAQNETDALKKLEANGESFERPVVSRGTCGGRQLF